jgi:hypothetical protein
MFTASSWVAKTAVKMGREEEGRKGTEEEEPGTKERPNCLLEWVVQVLSGHPCDTQIVSCAFLCPETFHVLLPYKEESLLLLLLLLLPHPFLRFFPSFLLTWIVFLQPLSAGILLLSVAAAAATASHLISAQNLAANRHYCCYCKCCFCLLGSAVH